MLAGIVTALLLVLFLAGWAWAWQPARASRFDAAARLPLDDDDEEDAAMTQRLVVVRDRAGRAQHRRLRLAAVVDRQAPRPATRSRKTPATSGTATSPSTTSRCRAGGSTCSTSPSCSRIGYLLWYPGLGSFAGYGKLDLAAANTRSEQGRATTRKLRGDLRAVSRPADRRAGARPAGASRSGRSIFNNTCATCHGSSAQGAIGYPNLTDDIWHWGGSPERVLQTVLDGREGVMPEWGKVLTGMGGDERGRLRGRLRAHAVDDPASMRNNYHGRAGQAAVRRRVRGLPRRRRQGQPGARRARPDRRLLAVRRQHRRRCARRSRRAATARCRRIARCSARRARAWSRPTSGRCRIRRRRPAPPTAARPRHERLHRARASTIRRARMAQRVGAILWPSFFAAGVATMVFFAFVDPLALRDMTFPQLRDRRASSATRIGFFMFWLATAVVQPVHLDPAAARRAASTAPLPPDAERNEPTHPDSSCSTTTAAASTSASARSIRATSSGRFDTPAHRSRWSWLLGMFYVFPWLRWDGRQAVLFDLPARKFHVFGLTFWPQDFLFLALLLIIAGAGAVLLHRAGRAPVVRLRLPADGVDRSVPVDGALDRGRPRRAHEARRRARGRATSCCARAASTCCGWCSRCGPASPSSASSPRSPTSPRAWCRSQWGGWETFWVLFYALATWGNAGFLREQVCKYMCPYARFQSAMFDRDTLIIAYDPMRGEPRGPRKRGLGERARSAAAGCSTSCTAYDYVFRASAAPDRRRQPPAGARHDHAWRRRPRRAAAAEVRVRGTGRLHRLHDLRAGLPDRHRHPQRPAIRVHRLRRLHRCLRRGDGQDGLRARA